jgi:hypothetical protein
MRLRTTRRCPAEEACQARDCRCVAGGGLCGVSARERSSQRHSPPRHHPRRSQRQLRSRGPAASGISPAAYRVPVRTPAPQVLLAIHSHAPASPVAVRLNLHTTHSTWCSIPLGRSGFHRYAKEPGSDLPTVRGGPRARIENDYLRYQSHGNGSMDGCQGQDLGTMGIGPMDHRAAEISAQDRAWNACPDREVYLATYAQCVR